MKTFRDWVAVRESTAFTRRRNGAALGLMPTIPNASINSHDTARPWVSSMIQRRNRGKLVSPPSDDGDNE